MDAPVTIPTDPLVWMARALREQGMASDDVELVLLAHDRSVLRGYLERHRERAVEVLAGHLRMLACVERFLAVEILRRDARWAPGR